MPERRNDPITIGEMTVPPGRKMKIELPVARMPTGSLASLPIAVINGRTSGPVVWVSGGVHGDEVNGVEVVRRVMRSLDAKNLRGAVIAVPIANPLGFLMRSRYLPDRRDLNRSFPGSARGSTASRLAHLFMTEVVSHCSVGIDCHTASNDRTNIPQIRADVDDAETLKLARAFGAPFTIKSRLRDGSMRQAATELGIKMLLFEAGQADRVDDEAVRFGVDGVLRTLRSMKMVDMRLPRPAPTRLVRRTQWVRARRGGLAEIDVGLGDRVSTGEVVAQISDAFGVRPTQVKSPRSGWVIARTLNPLVNPGDALLHIATEHGPERDEPAERRR
ncbi:MAG: succinylglutamate desuccinylase/aspartoacylase family protein [Acidimicrobiia bacterium]